MKRVEPITLAFEDGREYKLEFSRETVKAAEDNGFDPEMFSSKPWSMMSKLFHWAFRKNYPSITVKKTDEILFDELGAKRISDEFMDRLIELYNAPFESLYDDEEEDGEPKNARVKVIL